MKKGMNIYTTIDSGMQKNAVHACERKSYISTIKKYGWRDEQVFKDFNFSILKKRISKRGFFYNFIETRLRDY